MARYNLDGSLNELFGGNGKVITKTRGTNSCVRYQDEDKIILVSDSCLSRFNSDGSNDIPNKFLIFFIKMTFSSAEFLTEKYSP